jgi:hypothetical protein
MPEKSTAKVRLVTHGKSKSSGTTTLRVRKIRHSPVADPKKLEAARKSVQKLKRQKLQQKGEPAIEPDLTEPDDLEVPFITPGL